MSEKEDMSSIYSAIKVKHPNVKIKLLEKIEGIESKGIFELGEIVAQEIRIHCEK